MSLHKAGKGMLSEFCSERPSVQTLSHAVALLRYLHQLLIKAQLWANQGALKTFLQWIKEQS